MVPGKNKRPLAGKPLIAYSILAAKASRYLTSFVVSTDDQETADIAREFGASVPFMRPSELAQDDSGGLAVIQHAVGFLSDRGQTFDYVVLLQPTSPLRTAGDIDACIQKIVDTNSDSVMSMVELVDFSMKKLKRIESDVIVPFHEDEGPTTAPRHGLPRVYKRNGAAYLTRTALIMRGDLFGTVSRPYVMPSERSVDINTLADFRLAELYVTGQMQVHP